MSEVVSSSSGFLLGRGNRKLGTQILTFSLPAVSTCPGKSEMCESVCYATRGHMGMAIRPFTKRLKASKKGSFHLRMIDEISRRKPRTVRIHVSGDFYSAGYVRKWAAIAAACPDTHFYAYTRSWRVPEIRQALNKFSRL